MIKILHREIFKEHLSLFFLSLSCLLGVILLGRMLQLREILLNQDISGLDIVTLFFYLTPFFLLLLLPIACMLAVFLTFLRMSTDQELTALKASGVSLYQLLPAPLLFSILCTLLSLFISFHGISWGMEHFRGKIIDMVQTRTKVAVQAGIFNRDFNNLMFYANQVDEQTGEMRFVFVQDERTEGIEVNIVADTGQLITDPQRGHLLIAFKNGNIYRQEGDKLDVLRFGTYTIRLSLSTLFGQNAKMLGDVKHSELSVAMLEQLRADPNSIEGYEYLDPNKVRVELVRRKALPVGCFVLGLFAVPIGCVFRGLKQQYGLIMSLGMFLVYYSMFTFGVSFGETQTLAPEIGLWIPNGLFLLIGLYSLSIAKRERNVRLVTWLSHLRFWRRRNA